MTGGLDKRSIAIAGHRTSVALEPEFWAVLEAEALAEGLTLAALVRREDATRTPGQALASRLRLSALASAGSRGRSLPGD